MQPTTTSEPTKNKVPTEEEKKKLREKKKERKASKQKRKASRKASSEKKPEKVVKPHKLTSKNEAFKHLLQPKPRNYSVGNSIIHKLDLTRFVKWPKYVRLQRQRRILYKRLRVPPAINQFTHTVDRKLAQTLFKFLNKYRPEEKKLKLKRLKAEAKAKLDKSKQAGEKPGDKPKTTGTTATTTTGTATKQQQQGAKKPRPPVVHFGLNEVVALVERKKATLVVIAHDVDPIEMVVFLPGLCKKMGVPYCIVKGRSRLGKLVHQKQATCVALSKINKEDRTDYDNLIRSLNVQFSERYIEANRKWGGNKLSKRSKQHQKL
jgi:large subunit ribosomal protein L7Ae